MLLAMREAVEKARVNGITTQAMEETTRLRVVLRAMNCTIWAVPDLRPDPK